MEQKYKEGDITETGFEIIEVNIVYEYVFRKRVVTVREVPFGDTGILKIGSVGYFYMYPKSRGYVKIDGMGILFNLKESDYEFIEPN